MKLVLITDQEKLKSESAKAIEFFKNLESNQCNDVDIEACLKDFINVAFICHDVLRLKMV